MCLYRRGGRERGTDLEGGRSEDLWGGVCLTGLIGIEVRRRRRKIEREEK
jgi:hypothetical protein